MLSLTDICHGNTNTDKLAANDFGRVFIASSEPVAAATGRIVSVCKPTRHFSQCASIYTVCSGDPRIEPPEHLCAVGLIISGASS